MNPAIFNWSEKALDCYKTEGFGLISYNFWAMGYDTITLLLYYHCNTITRVPTLNTTPMKGAIWFHEINT